MRKLFIALLFLCASSARADFLQDLYVKYPAAKDAVVKKAFGNFYSVIRGNEVVFINDDLSILINGDVVDLKANRSLTATLRDANRPKFNISDLREVDAIKIGKGTRRIFVFSDPDCPYCRQLQSELGKLTDVAVHVYPLPLPGLHPAAAAIAESIWCSDNPAGAWNAYLIKGVTPVQKTCDNPIKRNAALAAKYQVFGTPAIVFEDGSVLPGAVPAATIEARLAAVAKK
jgi:thiol:disulfide interchange protein DsbC